MAVMKMKRVNICALRKNRKRILEALQRMGVMEIEDTGDETLEHIETASQKAAFERRAREAEQALEILDEYAPVKKGMLDSLKGKREIKQKEINNVIKGSEKIVGVCASIKHMKEEIVGAESKITAVNAELAALEPWLSCDIPMNSVGTAKTDISFGTVSASVSDARISEALEDFTAHYELVSQDKNTK